MERRPIGETDIDVSPVALGGWPITGITSLDVNETDSVATIRACLDHGINFVDTAYCYGPNGESEKLIRRALGDRRDEMVVATKAGVHWEPDGRQTHDGHPETLVRECEESLRRLGTDHVELLYLHRPDPDVPVAESAGALRGLMEAGKARCIGVSNFGVEHLEAFHPICPISAYQPCYNVLQREIEATTLPWCRARGISVMVYWPLMLGLLAGKLARDHGYVFGRKKTRRKSANGKKRQHPLHPLRSCQWLTPESVCRQTFSPSCSVPFSRPRKTGTDSDSQQPRRSSKPTGARSTSRANPEKDRSSA